MAYFGKFQRAIGNVGVWYLRQKNIGTLLEAIGITLDGAAESLSRGLRLGYPLRCPSDQLPVIAYDRRITLYPSEPDASRRERLRQWWFLHKQRASHQGEMRHVQPYFLPYSLPTIRIAHQNGDGSIATWHTLSTDGKYTSDVASPSNLNYDGKTSEWSRWIAFIDMSTTVYVPPHTYDSGGIYDTSGWQYDQGNGLVFTGAAGADVARMMVDWKANSSWCLGVVAVWPMVGGAPFPSASGTPTQDASGWWSLPNGHWGTLVDSSTGKGTRPPNFQWLFDNPSP